MKLNEKDILYLKNNFNIHFDIPFQTIKPSEFALVLYKEKEIRSKLLRFGWNEKHLNKLPRCKHSCDSQASTMN
ncbi:hypothetical protein, partial [Faecalitalea cylindroides]|uniref:hypothetical protein n=1 Tax=Faecalitalea cylindroides TaxID=39483 RepID=UPI001E4AA094